MNHKQIAITLDADAVFTRSSATVGRPASLDRIPGATLLGAAASRLYEALGDRAVEVFETGAVRFGDALPAGPDGTPALPTPLSWHREKRGDRVFDLSLAERPEGVQLTQLRAGWRLQSAGGTRALTVDRRSSMRTAINGGMAREGFLYGVEAVPAGTRFVASIAADDAKLLEQTVEALTRASIRLGRSRSAEFGGATVTLHTPAAATEPASPVAAGRLRLLAVSDLALRDPKSGGPRLVTTAADFGLDAAWQLDLGRSFLRFRRYSPFNGHRRRPESEHQVIVAGSVLTFHGPGLDAAALGQLRTRLRDGVGLHRGRGLGQLLAEPALLSVAEPRLIEGERSKGGKQAAPKPPSDPAFAVFAARAEALRQKERIWEKAVEASQRFHTDKPSAAQWGELRSRAQRARRANQSRQTFLDGLQDQVGRGLLISQWGRRESPDSPNALLFQALNGAGWERDADFYEFVEVLARRVERELKAKKQEGAP
jgi:CRISPR-associated protein Csx10